MQFVNESRFANREFANLLFDFDELQLLRFQIFSLFAPISMKFRRKLVKKFKNIFNQHKTSQCITIMINLLNKVLTTKFRCLGRLNLQCMLYENLRKCRIYFQNLGSQTNCTTRRDEDDDARNRAMPKSSLYL